MGSTIPKTVGFRFCFGWEGDLFCGVGDEVVYGESGRDKKDSVALGVDEIERDVITGGIVLLRWWQLGTFVVLLVSNP